eukprot:Pgem_evm1s13459
MNLGWVEPPYSNRFMWKGKTYTVPSGAHRNKNDVGATVLHEFGHAVGFAAILGSTSPITV